MASRTSSQLLLAFFISFDALTAVDPNSASPMKVMPSSM